VEPTRLGPLIAKAHSSLKKTTPSNSSSSPRPRGLSHASYYPLIIVGLAVLSHGGFSLSGQGFTPFYPFIQDEFVLTRTQVGFVSGAIYGAATFTSAGVGWAVDRLGVRLIGGALMIVSGFVVMSMYFASAFWMVLLVGAAMGALRPAGHPAGARAIMDWIGKDRRGTAMSIKQAGNPALSALAALAVPSLAVAFGWRIAAVALGGFIATAGLVIVMLYRERPTTTHQHKESTSFLKGMGQVMRDKQITMAIIFGFPLVGAQVATLTYFMLFLKDELGVSVLVAGGLLAMLQVSSIVMRIGWGVISDTLGGGRRKPVLLVSGLATAAVLFALALLPGDTPYWALVLVAIALGATATSWVSVHTVLLAELSGPGRVGTTVGYASALQRMSIVITPPIFGFLADQSGYQTAWFALSGVILVGMLMLTQVREGNRSHEAA
jgi:ACS family hexuronate transporter-like MFS transporter